MQTNLCLRNTGNKNMCSAGLSDVAAGVLINKSYEKIPLCLSIALSNCYEICGIFSKNLLNIGRFAAVFCIVFVAGCIPLNYIGHNKIADLQDELAQLHIYYKEFQQSQADLYTKFNSASAEWNALIQDLQNKIAALEQKICSLAAADRQAKEDGDNFILSSSLYGRAYGDYLAGKYDLAYSGFQSFIDKYPDDEQVSKARFYIDECLKMSGKSMSLHND